MYVLYRAQTKEYVVIEAGTRRAVFTGKKSKATKFLTKAEAEDLLTQRSSKLKNFTVLSLEQNQTEESNLELLKTPTGREATSEDALIALESNIRRPFTKEERSMVYIRDKGICQVCGKFVTIDNLSVDHIVPVSQGGTYDLTNLRCTCLRCNQLKDRLKEDSFQEFILDAAIFQLNTGNKKFKKKLKSALKNLRKSEKKAC